VAATSNPFELLGLPLHFDLRKADLDARLRDLSKVLHPDRHAGAGASDRRLVLNRAIAMNEAVRVLRDPVARGHALLAALRPSGHVEEVRVDQVFLFDVMELREELANAQKARDWARVRSLGERAQTAWNESIERLTKQFTELAEVSDANDPENAASALLVSALLGELAKLKYWQRLTEEVGRIEAEQD
jgi:molecular chaperone HscB